MKKLKVLDLFSGYTIREDGVVTSRFGRVLKPEIGKAGYVRVELSRDGIGKKYLLHRLVAQAFIPNPNDLPQVNHIDGNKQNNLASNLEWTTQSGNQLHAYKNGLQVGYRKPTPLNDAHKSALCGSRWNYETHVYDVEGKRFLTAREAADHFGVSEQTILNRCKSERWPTWSKQIERR